MKNSFMKLSLGDTIGLVATASKFDVKAFEQAKRKLIDLGFKIKHTKSIYLNDEGFAGNPKKRANDLNKMFADPKVKAVFCIRGGFGSQHIIPFLNTKLIKENPKIFLGFSDITVLHLYLEKACNLACFHGPSIIAAFQNQKLEKQYIKDINDLFIKTDTPYSITFPKGKYKDKKIIKAKVTGGNLSLLITSIGTVYEFNAKNKILFIEDVNEKMYKIDRMLSHLYYAKKFNGIKALIFGQMCKKSRELKYKKNIEKCLKRLWQNNKIPFPIIYSFPSGHYDSNRIIPLERTCEINIKEGLAKFI
ncbi:MAG: LD-carboxypeptidase [Pseudomonadota bacterium]